jgi:hypothetical protein
MTAKAEWKNQRTDALMTTSTPEAARTYAIAMHGDQKYGPHPYVHHLDAVVALLQPYGEKARVVGYLHDVVEDTDATVADVQERFGDLVARCVSLLTDAPGANRKERKAGPMRRWPRSRATKNSRSWSRRRTGLPMCGPAWPMGIGSYGTPTRVSTRRSGRLRFARGSAIRCGRSSTRFCWSGLDPEAGSGRVHRPPDAPLRECPPGFALLFYFAAGSTRWPAHLDALLVIGRSTSALTTLTIARSSGACAPRSHWAGP